MILGTYTSTTVIRIIQRVTNGPLYPTYGNYGGGGYTGGEFDGTDFNVPAVDDLDQAYKNHDNTYSHTDEHQAYEANKALLDDIDDLRNDPNSDWNNGTMNDNEKLYGALSGNTPVIRGRYE